MQSPLKIADVSPLQLSQGLIDWFVIVYDIPQSTVLTGIYSPTPRENMNFGVLQKQLELRSLLLLMGSSNNGKKYTLTFYLL